MDKATLRQLLGDRKLGGQRNQCPSCGLAFNTDRGFDQHRVASTKGSFMPRRCLSPTELREKGWSINTAGFWVVPIRGRGWQSRLTSKPRHDA